jgi:hypothetical protein
MKLADGTMVLDRRLNLGAMSEVCSFCAHFDREDPLSRRCRAFTKGIPEEIWTGQNLHTSPYEGDGGIQFEAQLYPGLNKQNRASAHARNAEYDRKRVAKKRKTV